MLFPVLVLCLLGAITVLLSDQDFSIMNRISKSGYKGLKIFCTVLVSFAFLVSILSYVFYDLKIALFQHISDSSTAGSSSSVLKIGVDSFSLLFVLLTTLTFPICFLIS